MTDEAVDGWMRTAYDYWHGALDHISADVPDGAWFQMHIDVVEFHLLDEEIHYGLVECIGKPPVDADPHDIVMAYFREQSRREGET